MNLLPTKSPQPPEKGQRIVWCTWAREIEYSSGMSEIFVKSHLRFIANSWTTLTTTNVQYHLRLCHVRLPRTLFLLLFPVNASFSKSSSPMCFNSRVQLLRNSLQQLMVGLQNGGDGHRWLCWVGEPRGCCWYGNFQWLLENALGIMKNVTVYQRKVFRRE